jgi:heptosyltransferase-2
MQFRILSQLMIQISKYLFIFIKMNEPFAKPWKKAFLPKKILIIRFQAIGDVVITFPYLQSLIDQHPGVQFDFMTRKECVVIPTQLKMFNKVIEIGGGRNARIQFLASLFLLPYLWCQQYDVVIDLQNHRISRWIRKSLFTRSWGQFDRASPVFAGERTRIALQNLNLGEVRIETNIRLKKEVNVHSLLKQQGWDGVSKLVVLNPAGAFETRHWPIENYIAFAELWLKKEPVQFLLIGLKLLNSRTAILKERLGRRVIDLAGLTTSLEAFVLVKQTKLILTEDSGLMHMAWVQGVPTLALFGSTRSDWSSPLGENSACLNSSDLPCGNCMLEQCRFNDNRCLTRYTPQFVFEQAQDLIQRLQ